MFTWIWQQIAKFSITKFLSGFNLINGEKLGKIIFTVLVVLACMWVVNKFFTPKVITNTPISGNQSVVVQQCDPKMQDKLIAEARKSGKNDALFRIWFIRMF